MKWTYPKPGDTTSWTKTWPTVSTPWTKKFAFWPVQALDDTSWCRIWWEHYRERKVFTNIRRATKAGLVCRLVWQVERECIPGTVR